MGVSADKNLFRRCPYSVSGVSPCILQIIGLFAIPESPRWLAKVGRDMQFEVTLQRLRGKNADIFRAAADIREYTEAFEWKSQSRITDLFQRRYAHSIIVSAAGTCLGCFLTGLSFLSQDLNVCSGVSPFPALVGVLVYSGSFSLGMGGIPCVIMSEIFPISMKGSAGSLVTVVSWLGSWITSFAFSFMMDWSSPGTFFIFSGICGFTVVFVAKLVPEMKGRTLEEIQASLNPL